MTKNEIIRGLQKLSPSRIEILDIIYHKDTPEGSIRFIYNWIPRDCMYCSSLSDFINIKNIKNGKIY